MYVHFGDDTWHLVWKIVFEANGIVKLWIGSRQFVALGGPDAEQLRARLKDQDPMPGRSLVWTEPLEENADVSPEAERAIAGRISYRRGG